MIQNSQIPRVMILYVKEAFSYCQGSLLLLSAPLAGGFSEIMKVLMDGVDDKDIYLPLIFSGVTAILYFFLFCADFVTGLVASREEAKETDKTDFVQSSKLWRSFWKLFGVMAMLLMLLIFCLLLAISGIEFFYSFFLYSILAVMLMVCLFEHHSIGENIKRRFGYKPRYFEFFDKLAKVVEIKIIERVKNVI